MVLSLFALAGCASTIAEAVLGQAPTYLDGGPTRDVPNGAALRHRIWTPALDEGFVPQGLTSAGDVLYVSSYRPTPDLKANTGPCRVFRIDVASGRVTGGFDVPPGCPVVLRGDPVKLRMVLPGDLVRVTYEEVRGSRVARLVEVVQQVRAWAARGEASPARST